MKSIALFFFLLAATVFAEEANIQHIADKFETNVETVQVCIGEAGTNLAELHVITNNWATKLQEDEIDEATKGILTRFYTFLACMLEKKEMMKDSKLVLDKILESMDKEKMEHASKDAVTECVNTLNEDNEIKREGRAIGLLICMFPDKGDANAKK